VIAANSSLTQSDSVASGADEQMVLRADNGLYITNTGGVAPFDAESPKLINTSAGSYMSTSGRLVLADALTVNSGGALIIGNVSISGTTTVTSAIVGAAGNSATSLAGATPDVGNRTVVRLNYASVTAITNLLFGIDGQYVTLIAVNANVSIIDAGNFRLSANWTPNADDTILLVLQGGAWYEIMRSSN
jgi:hypothetical protein